MNIDECLRRLHQATFHIMCTRSFSAFLLLKL